MRPNENWLRHFLFSVPVCLGAGGLPAAAALDGPLTHLDGTAIVVEELAEEDQRCGLRADTLESDVAGTFVAHGLEVNDAPSSFLYLQVTTVYLDDHDICASSIRIAHLYGVDYADYINRAKRYGQILTFDRGLIVSSPRADHAARVRSLVEDGVLQFVDTWQIANEGGYATSAGATPVAAQPTPLQMAQTRLYDLGFYDGPNTGFLDQGTRRALTDFQEAAGLTPTGTLDPLTARELLY
jgi:Putative peptidoglycan binding domain